MKKYNMLQGFVTLIEGESPDADSAIEFNIFVPSESRGDPYNSQAEAEEGQHSFKFKKVTDNRELVWVSLLRDAMVHKLLVRVSYSYILDKDPGTGEITKIEVIGNPFQPGRMEVVKAKVIEISIYEHFAWRDKFKILAADIIDVASISLDHDPQGILILPLRETNRETKLAQLGMLQRAWENQWDVTITYWSPPPHINCEKLITGVSFSTY